MDMIIARMRERGPRDLPPAARASGGLRDMLRSRTGEAHARIDATLGAVDLASGHGFARFLAAHRMALIAIQPTVTAFVAKNLGKSLPDAVGMIDADLTDLGHVTPAAAPAAEPTRAGAAGVAYVVLGSRMGMTVLARGETWPARHGRAGRYLGDRHMAALWKPMCAWLRRQPAEGTAAEAALAGALAAFALFADAARACGIAAPVTVIADGARAR